MTERDRMRTRRAAGFVVALLVWLAAVVIFGLLLFAYRYLGVLASGDSEPYLEKLIDEMTGALVGGLLFFPVRELVRRVPLAGDAWRRRLPIYGAVLPLFGATATTLMWGLRSVLYPLAGLGPYDYGVMPLRYFMEMPMQAIMLVSMVAAIHAVDLFRASREREVQAARLESSLAQAQLRNLRLQLQPHFLFNALNTISSTMYRDPAAADEMMAQLSELLRVSLQASRTDEVPLASERHLLDQYVAIMKARFGDRLTVAMDLQQGTENLLVPSMILQPLVENAIRHGNATAIGRGRVEVTARLAGDRLVLEVQDDGPGPAEGKELSWGVGLTATAERLRLLYGDSQEFTTGRSDAGGFRVTASFPPRPATTAGHDLPAASEALR